MRRLIVSISTYRYIDSFANTKRGKIPRKTLGELKTMLDEKWWENRHGLLRAHRDCDALCGRTIAAGWAEGDNKAVRESLGSRAGLANVSGGLRRKLKKQEDDAERKERKRMATSRKNDVWGLDGAVTGDAEDLTTEGMPRKQPGWKWCSEFTVLDINSVRVVFNLTATTSKVVRSPACARHDHALYPISASLGVTRNAVLTVLRDAEGQPIGLRCNGHFCNMDGVCCQSLDTLVTAVWLSI